MTVGALFEEFNHFVNVGKCDCKTFKDMCSFLCLFKVKLGATCDDVFLVDDVVFKDFFQVENLGHTVNQCKHNH